MKIRLKTAFILIPLFFIVNLCFAQDLIYKINGDTIKAKIIEVGTAGISFKKASSPDGPTFVENKSDIIMIKFSNGEIQKFAKSVPTSTASVMTKTNSANSNTTSTSSNTTATASSDQSDKVKIERDGKKYKINGQKATQKQVYEQLGKSKNPAIIVPLKATKTMGGASKIVKIMNYPASIGGGFTTLTMGIDMYNDIQRGRADQKSYINAITSLVGTMVLPITNKILKKKSGKMNDKLIDIYNQTN
jgi:hypothetical protein